ncbi:hypothetical protein N7474_009037 [Penicillium riverlandense]|uniref:uncharacterized protein n=1 Tax=Penicillium riverlandense TaxID=1903569 RepID=UPI002548D302|nr:uncharacterized protein N7474_009037 [Penicillium riverlandense]KAJ5807768.1 hypothetical protein N7474_009037 [Penicillium riverlandense]
MASPSAITRAQVHITTHPVPRKLGDSKLVLAALQKFGEVVTFRNLKYDVFNTNPKKDESILAIFGTPDAAERAIAASPITIPLSPPKTSLSSLFSSLTATSSPNAPNTPPTVLTCTISPSYHNHARNLRRNPFHSTYNIYKKNPHYEDLTGKETAIPLRELADVLASRKYYISNAVKEKIAENSKALGAGSLMGLWRKGQGMEGEKQEQMGKEDRAREIEKEQKEGGKDIG